jgi:hypothetical protein
LNISISSVNDLNNATPADYNLYVPYIKAGEFYRAYVLSDYRLNHSDYVTAVPIVQDDKNNPGLSFQATASGGGS